MNSSINQKANQLQAESIQYFQNQEYEHALTKMEEAIKLDSHNAQYFCDRGAILYNLKRYQKTLDDYNAAINLDSSDPEFFYHKAFILHKIYNNSNEALQSIAKGLSLDPHHKELLELQKSIHQ